MVPDHLRSGTLWERLRLPQLKQQHIRAAAVRSMYCRRQSVVTGVLIQSIPEALVEVIHLVIGATECVMPMPGDGAASGCPETVPTIPVLIKADAALAAIPADADDFVFPDTRNGGTSAAGFPRSEIDIPDAGFRVGMRGVFLVPSYAYCRYVIHIETCN